MKFKTLSQIAKVILLFPLLFSSVSAVSTVHAAETTDTVNVTLHKRVFDEGALQEKTNTGEIDSNFGGTPLSGVTFTVYDVTDHYLNLRQNGATAQEAVQQVQSDSKNNAPSYATELSNGVTAGSDGTVTFSNLASKDGDKDKVYLFLETNSPTNITQKAAPIVLALPIYKDGSNSVINSDIHVYPKNIQSEAITKDLDDKSKANLLVTLPDGSQTYNATVGQSFGYSVTVAVPWNIADKDTFTVVDIPDAGIDDDASTILLTGTDGTKLVNGSDYTVTTVNATSTQGMGFKIAFNPASTNVQAMAGKKIIISYQATLTNALTPDKGANNTATLNIGNGTDITSTPSTSPEIFTGGIKFVKKDKQSQAKLANAVFQLVKIDSNNKIISYATQATDGKYSWNTTSAGATSYTSDSNGLVSLQGLEYSEKLQSGQNYALLEVTAPSGYALLTAPVQFTVDKGTFDDNQTITITNIKKGILPSTGGSGIYIFLLVGSILMGIAYMWNRMNKKDQSI